MGIKHEAFIDLEEGLAKALVASWQDYWMPLSRSIGLAADDGEWDKAQGLVHDLSLAGVFKRERKMLRTLGMASMLLGASRLRAPKKTDVYANPPTEWVDNAEEQAEALFEEAAKAVRLNLLTALHDREYRESSSNSATIEKANARRLSKLSIAMANAAGNRGNSYMALTANLQTSRLASAGFLLESVAMGRDWYQVSEVMDKKTCAVCERMHGQTFSVPAGLNHISRVMSTANPTVLRSIAPWPTDLSALRGMSTADMVNAGLALPPYHPGCRGIVIPAAGAAATGQSALFGASAGIGLGITSLDGAEDASRGGEADSGRIAPGSGLLLGDDSAGSLSEAQRDAQFDEWFAGFVGGLTAGSTSTD